MQQLPKTKYYSALRQKMIKLHLIKIKTSANFYVRWTGTDGKPIKLTTSTDNIDQAEQFLLTLDADTHETGE